MDAIFRLNGAVRHEPDIDAWLNERDGELGVIARRWFQHMRLCGDDVRELIHDGCPVACVDNAAFAYVNVFRSHVNVGFFHGADLPDPVGLLEGTGRRMRHVKLRPEASSDHRALEALIEAAYADVRWRLSISSEAP